MRPQGRFALDSPLEGDGFELPVPREIGAGAPLSKRLWEYSVNRSKALAGCVFDQDDHAGADMYGVSRRRWR